jgi:hypothetical protein
MHDGTAKSQPKPSAVHCKITDSTVEEARVSAAVAPLALGEIFSYQLQLHTNRKTRATESHSWCAGHPRCRRPPMQNYRSAYAVTLDVSSLSQLASARNVEREVYVW